MAQEMRAIANTSVYSIHAREMRSIAEEYERQANIADKMAMSRATLRKLAYQVGLAHDDPVLARPIRD